MFTHHRAAPQRRKADAAFLARAGMAIAHPDRTLAKIDAATVSRRFAEKQRRAGGRIHLVLVVHFQNFDIPACGIKRAGSLPHQFGEQVDAKAHIPGFDDAGMARCGLDLLVIRR